MLTQLDIQGLAIIDSLSINFSHGFNVITGETGAGKSILIKALGLLLGAKASAETVRRGRDLASVSGFFEAPSEHACAEVLARYGIPIAGDKDGFGVLVRRTVTNKGRSLAWINDVPVTVTVLRELAMSLIDVFGQHENLRLLDPAQHLSYVDLFIKEKSLLASYSAEFAEAQVLLKDLIDLVEGFRSKRRDADYLGFRCDELRKFAPSKDDYTNIQDLCRRSSHQLTLAKGLEDARACIDQGAGGEPLGRAIWEAGRILRRLASVSPELGELGIQLENAAGQIDDLSFQIGKATSRLELDEADLEEAQARLAGYQELFRKLAVPGVEDLLEEQTRLEAELTFLASAADEVVTRLLHLKSVGNNLRERAAKLSRARKKAKDQAKLRIEAELHELAMPGAVIDIEFSSVQRAIPAMDLAAFGQEAIKLWSEVAATFSELGDAGAERAQFLLAANPGEATHPLQKIASGGEISRVMLALKKALAAGADTCILVFDEIDTGISGRVADVVGRKMQELSQSFQVICISHLAQVAAHADTHLLVHKFQSDQRTESTITRLSLKESEEEVARLLSGQELTPSSLANAKALMKKARQRGKAPPAAAPA